MSIKNTMLKLRKITVSTQAGADPDAIVEDMDRVHDQFPEIVELCTSARAPAGQCDYTWRDNFHACIYCGKPSGLDE